METTQQVHWEPAKFAPANESLPDFRHHSFGMPNLIHTYHTECGAVAGYICRFDLSDGKKAMFPFSWGTLGDKAGWHWKGLAQKTPPYNLLELLARTEATVLIVEGEKTCDAAKELFPEFVCTTSIGGSNAAHKTDWSYFKGRKVIIFRDNDAAGLKYQQSLFPLLQEKEVLEIKYVNIPANFSEGWDLADPIPGEYSLEQIKTLIKDAQIASSNPTKESDWEPLKPILSVLSVPPDISLEMIPPSIRNWVEDEVTRIGTRLASFTAVVISTVAIIVGLKIVICPKRFDTGWKVSLAGLWLALVGRSASKKSPTITPALKMIHYLEKKAKAKFSIDRERNKPEIIAIEATIEGIRKKITESTKNNDEEEKANCKKQLAEALARQKELMITEHRYTIQDTTIEQFQKLMIDNPNGLGLVFDEMTAWINGLERKGHETARSTYLKAHNGLQDDRIERVTRDEIHIPRLFAVVIGGIQPDPFNKMLMEAISGTGSGSDGLLPRFQLSLVHSLEGVAKGEDRNPKESELLAIYKIADKLDQLSTKNTNPDENDPFQIHFDNDAQELFNEWHDQHQNLIQNGNLHHTLESHLSKQAATMPALALAFELLNWASKSPNSFYANNIEQDLTHKPYFDGPKNVSLQSAKLAACWIEYLTAHMKCLYQPSLNPAAEGAHAILKQIRSKRLESGFSLRELVRYKWSHLTDQKIVEQAIGILEDSNCLREQSSKRPPVGRSPSPRYEINPAVFEEAKYGI
jgi:hypothetical protein